MNGRCLIGVVVLVLATEACVSDAATPSVDVVVVDLPSAEPSAALDGALLEAIEVRERYGLRSDVDWVRGVAADPDAITPESWGIPLMPHELADLMSRRWSNELLIQVRNYGLEFPKDFATAAVNLQATGVWIAFKANLERHRRALAALPLDGRVEVRQMKYSIKELEDHLFEVTAERAWIESTGARWVDPVIYELDNKVVIRYEGPVGIENLIERHFGGGDWLEARWEGPG